MPIPGTRRQKYLEENAGAADVRLTEKEMAALETALAPDRVSGARYGEKLMAQVDR